MSDVDWESNRNTPDSTTRLFNWVTGMAAVVCVAAVTVSAIANLAIPSMLAPSETIQEDMRRDAVSGTITRSDYLESFAWAARIKLEDLSLHHSLTVTATGDGGLLVSGKVIDELSNRYDHFKNWYLARQNFPRLDEEVQFVASAGPVPDVKSIWFGETPTAFFNDGTSGGIGETIGNGWTILRIEETGIVLERNGSVISIEY